MDLCAGQKTCVGQLTANGLTGFTQRRKVRKGRIEKHPAPLGVSLCLSFLA